MPSVNSSRHIRRRREFGLIRFDNRRPPIDLRSSRIPARANSREAAFRCGSFGQSFSKLAAQLTRPEPAPPPRVGNASPKLDRPNRQVPPPRPQPKPKRLIGREEQLEWISTIISARRQAPHPKDDATQPPLFSDAEARALVWYAAQYDRWLVDRSARGKSDIIVGEPPSATEIARGAHVSLRTVRRALKSAIAAGLVENERAGKGRGKRAVYALTSPPPGWRHDSISAHSPRRQKGATYDTDSPQE